jgi:hypothetical protein
VTFTPDEARGVSDGIGDSDSSHPRGGACEALGVLHEGEAARSTHRPLGHHPKSGSALSGCEAKCEDVAESYAPPSKCRRVSVAFQA